MQPRQQREVQARQQLAQYAAGLVVMSVHRSLVEWCMQQRRGALRFGGRKGSGGWCLWFGVKH
eukprot:scaffold230637_cov10-Tisochrysis_lutea.AAC.1